MTFDYEEITPDIKRPIIQILLKSKTSFIIYQALIDAGADYCLFNIDLAKLLDINLSDKNKVDFVGVGKEKLVGYKEEITLRIGDISYLTNVIFADISDFEHGILGHKGFFDHFDVHLRYTDLKMEIIPILNS
jgi:hypothetical protein